jgi:hypothetical protein
MINVMYTYVDRCGSGCRFLTDPLLLLLLPLRKLACSHFAAASSLHHLLPVLSGLLCFHVRCCVALAASTVCR